LTICAERSAIFNAVSKGHRKLEAVAVACIDAAPDASHSSRMPCGACRQVMAEFGDDGTPVVVDGVGQTSWLDFCLSPSIETGLTLCLRAAPSLLQRAHLTLPAASPNCAKIN